MNGTHQVAHDQVKQTCAYVAGLKPLQHCFGDHNLAPDSKDMVVRVAYRDVAAIRCTDAREDWSTKLDLAEAMRSKNLSMRATNTCY
jgi:hypothetical protein